MPTVVYLRGIPGTGKRVVSDILERDLSWPVLWVHLFDPLYKAIGEYKVPRLTDRLMKAAAMYLMDIGRDFIVARPSRDFASVEKMRLVAALRDYRFIPVRLTASYNTLITRVTRRWHESPYRLTTKEALDEYLAARPESDFPGETVIDTDKLTPEQVAGKIKELLP